MQNFTFVCLNIYDSEADQEGRVYRCPRAPRFGRQNWFKIGISATGDDPFFLVRGNDHLFLLVRLFVKLNEL